MELYAPENAGVKAFPTKLKTKVSSITKSCIQLGKDDPRRVKHALKVALAITLVSLIYYDWKLYNAFGLNGIWAVLTVVVVFEYTAGGTISRGLNRGLASFLAGALAYGADQFATQIIGKYVGKKGVDIALGFFVFIIAAGATFTRFHPHIKARYDYGVMIFILTFSLVAVYGSRVPYDFKIAWERLATVLIGGAACIIVSIFIYPVWAGEDLHNSVASNLEKLANYLEGFGDVYFRSRYNGKAFGKGDVSFLQEYKFVLDSKKKEESLANYAWWEPGHSHFRFRHPWKQYLKIGDLARECACLIEAIHRQINSDIQPSPEFQSKIQESCTRMSAQSGKALRELAIAIQTMTEPTSSTQTYLDSSKAAMRGLKTALKGVSFETTDLLAILPAATVASILVEIVQCVEKISTSVHKLSELAHFKTAEPTGNFKQFFHAKSINPIANSEISLDKIIIVQLTSRQINNEPIPNGHVSRLRG